MSVQELVEQSVNGLALGSSYALLALGLAMVFSIMGLINFAHGELLTIGGYTMWIAFEHGVPWPFVIPITLLFHNFWPAPADQYQNQMGHFMKNFTIMGGMLMVWAFGPGRFAFDRDTA